MRSPFFLLLVGCGAPMASAPPAPPAASPPEPEVVAELVPCSERPFVEGLRSLLLDRAASVCACAPATTRGRVALGVFADPARGVVSVSEDAFVGVQADHAACAGVAAYSVVSAWTELAGPSPVWQADATDRVWDLESISCADVAGTDTSRVPTNGWIDAHPLGLERAARFDPECRIPSGLRIDVAYDWGS